jgi:electron transfer flavoprotein alpha subunit
MGEKQAPVWVIADQVDCRIQSVSFQLTGQARKLADELQTSVEVVLMGDSITDQPQELIAAGADRVYLGNAPDLSFYHPELYTDIIVRLAREQQPAIMLLGSTSMGRELAPLVAARLKTGLTAHCIDLVLDENQVLEQRIPAYGGLLSIICPEKRPQMATVASGVFPKPTMDADRSGEVVNLEIPNDVDRRIEILEVVLEEQEGVPLENAPVIVAGGAGAGDAGGWQQIDDLAKLLNAALGCTRPAVDEGWADLETMVGQSGVDEGWADLETMVGQSGKMVSPECYIGVGLSGELQHMVGIVGAQIMVAINNDAKSPVFEQVDFGIVDDCREFLPVKEYKEKQVTC